jgi:hypothetical protein
MEAYLSGLKRDKLLALLEIELEKRFAEYRESGTVSPSPWQVSFRGLGEGELNTLLKKLVTQTVVLQKEDSLFSLPGNFPAIVINTPSVRITASADIAAQTVLEDKRAELVSALLGEDIFND